MLQVETAHYVLIAGEEVFMRGGMIVGDDHPAVARNPDYFTPLSYEPSPGDTVTEAPLKERTPIVRKRRTGG